MAAKEKVKAQRKVPLSDIIREEAEEVEREEMGADPAFDPDRDLGASFHGPRAFAGQMRDKDQLVLDELLASLPKNQGYYLKLYREIMPGKFELKERIDQYDTWTDMELEISDRVKAMTRKFGVKKWGSGLYRVVIWRNGGIRERNKYPPIDVVVDAGDNEDAAANMHTGKVDPMEAANEQLHALGNMLGAVQNIMPKAVDPNVQFQAIVQAFTAGKAEKAQAEASSSQMMMTMLTGMMNNMMAMMQAMAGGKNMPVVEQKPFEEQMAAMMNVLKGFGFGQPPAQKTLVEQIAEMKLLGWDPTAKEDTIEQIAKLKAMTGALVDVLPQGGQAPERPGIFEKLVDALAPHVPKIFSDMKAITENAALAQQMQALRVAERGPQPTPVNQRPTTVYGQPVGPQPRMGVQDAFQEPPEMDPYSGFTTRPFQQTEEEGAGIEMFGSVEGANPAERRQAMTQPQQAPQQPVRRAQPVRQQAPQPEVIESVAQQPSVMPPMLQQLYMLIYDNRVDAYGGLYDVLFDSPESRGMIEAVQKKLIDGNGLAEELRKTGFREFNAPEFVERTQTYLRGFVEWILEHTLNQVHALCPVCAAEHIFESKYEFLKTDQVCKLERSGTEMCQGLLKLVTNAKEPSHVKAT